jgi:precorrin-2/cobalt-factor-2 C20-methyltransferase
VKGTPRIESHWFGDFFARQTRSINFYETGFIMKGTFYVVGAGPGDPKLLTLKGAEVLEKCPVWFIPTAFKDTSKSIAFDIASAIVSSADKTILNHYFPMKKIHRGEAIKPEVKEAWENGAKAIMEHLKAGRDVVMPTLGDPGIYSTALYVCETLQAFGSPFTINIIPGVPAIAATAAEAQLPLCLGDDRLVIIPATFENEKIKELLCHAEAAAFMKVGQALDRLIPLIEELGLIDHTVLVERASLPDQRIWYDIRKAKDEKLHYFSTMLVRSAHDGEPLA